MVYNYQKDANDYLLYYNNNNINKYTSISSTYSILSLLSMASMVSTHQYCSSVLMSRRVETIEGIFTPPIFHKPEDFSQWNLFPPVKNVNVSFKGIGQENSKAIKFKVFGYVGFAYLIMKKIITIGGKNF